MAVSTDYALSLLPSQFYDSPILKELLKIYVEEFEEIQQCLDVILLQRSLEYAEGKQLDGLGDILGFSREARSDSEYREILNLQILINSGEGNYLNVTRMWRTLLVSETATLMDEYPAGVALFSDVGVPTLEVLNTLKKTLPATVTLSLTSTFDSDPAFCFFGGDGEGFGTTGDPDVGGKLIGRYTDTI